MELVLGRSPPSHVLYKLRYVDTVSDERDSFRREQRELDTLRDHRNRVRPVNSIEPSIDYVQQLEWNQARKPR